MDRKGAGSRGLANYMLVSLLALIAVSGCRSAHTIEISYEPRSMIQQDTQRNDAAFAHDPVAMSLGIRPLRQAILPADDRELRLSTGAGMIFGAPYGILRIVARDSSVDGEVWVYRGVRSRDGTTEIKVARVRLRPDLDWKQVLTSLDSLNADRIAVPSDGWMVSDAGELYVESLRGATYLTTWVNAPRVRKGPEARTAAAVAALVDSLVRHGVER